jgi:endonuclease/exonuclease/phosphatase family metal-dependent hydrolase
LRVLSYNIHHGRGLDGKLDLPRIARVIRDAAPDLVALQEVDRNTKRTGRVDQSAELGKLTGLHAGFARAIPLEGGEYGQALLARFHLQGVKGHRLPGKQGQETRIVMEARVQPDGGLPALTFLGTHFQHDDARTREEQAARVNELFGAAAGPVILAGDLNATPDSPPLKVLGKAWSVAAPPGKELLTFPADVPRRQIDYVLFRPTGAFRVTEARVIEEKVASDHRPVLVVLELVGK